ncbi:TPA: transposase [Candidatus Bathyarchaeota archaeon]|nr:transposase [Candidatus Bathyarchaeota archaeon]
MKNRGRLEPCYNAHAAVDTGSHLVVEYDVSRSASDAHALSPLAVAAKEALGVEGLRVVADKGFFDASGGGAVPRRWGHALRAEARRLREGSRGPVWRADEWVPRRQVPLRRGVRCVRVPGGEGAGASWRG